MMDKGQHLDSWKDISAYLKRSIRTCQLWERELGLPVHRLDGSSRARVFAYTGELDVWRKEKAHEQIVISRRLRARVLFLLGLIIAGFLVWTISHKRGAGAPVNMENSIAVISFENQTGDRVLDDYRRIIPNLLITSLEQTRSFYVMSAERMRDVLKQIGKGDAEFIDSDLGFDVCREEGVRSLVAGSYYRAGDTFITEIKVLDVRSRRLRRTARAQGSGPESVFTSQVDVLSRQIASALGVAKEELDASLRPVGEFGTRSEEAYKCYLQGSEHIGNYDNYKARESLQKAVEIDPEFAKAHLLLSQAYFGGTVPDIRAGLGAIEKAYALSENATKKERLQIAAAHADRVEKNKSKYFSLIKEYVAEYPKEKGAHDQLGRFYRDKDPGKAIEEFSIALSLDPNYEASLTNLGYLYLDRKDFTKAMAYFRRQVIAAPENPNSYDALAECYFLTGKVDEAKSTLRKISVVSPGQTRFDAPHYINALEENYEETLRLWDQALEVSSAREKSSGYRRRAFYRGWLGDLNGSLSDLLLADELAGTLGQKGMMALNMWYRSWLYLDQNELDLSRKSLEAFYALRLTETPEYRALHDLRYNEMLGHIECAEGRPDSAELRWRAMEALIPGVAALNPTDSASRPEALKYEAGLLRAEVGLAQGRIDEVIGLLTKTPLRPQAYSSRLNYYFYNMPFHKDVLARAYAKKGDSGKAIAEYERLTTFDHRKEAQFLIHPKYHYRLGLLYEQKGLKAKAAERYRKFLMLWKAADPGLAEVKDARARLAGLKGS